MTLLLLLLVMIALAVLTPRFGVDSRDFTVGPGSPPFEDKLWSRQP
jgi:hypothetical protein